MSSSKAAQFRSLINSNKLEFIMEAHNGLSAKIVEEAGFKGIWGSGLSISAAMGVRDNNEASWTQVLDVLEFMSDATSVPILLDGDTGYGNFNNMRRLIMKLEQREIGGVCIEDKLFPKTNSFIGGENQPLADIDEFCGKIKAAKDTQRDDDFVVVARLEAFIAGWGLNEALKRAEAYRQAGADAILCHSKKSNSSDVEAFMKEWGDRHPVIIVPTKYYSTPTNKFRDLGISMAIWANHNIRSSVKVMQETSKRIFEDESLINVESKIVGVSEIFRLQGAEELQQAEKRYLPTAGKKVNNIILAASQGTLGELTKEIPKTLLKVNGKTILGTQIDEFNKVGIKDISVVRGFEKEKISFNNINTIDNDNYKATKELASLYLAKDQLKENTIVSYGDIIFKSYVLVELLNDENDITIVVDADAQKEGSHQDFVKSSEPYSKGTYSKTVDFEQMSYEMEDGEIDGEFIGLWKVSEKGAAIVREALETLAPKEGFDQMTCTDLFNEIAKSHTIKVQYIKGSWLDIDSIVDLQKAGAMYVSS
ncbi:phosphoenolpyruvate mutase [Fulvivirgaceae bacterium BMA10]|uniref:phosphoenolpyruvate mutase n=1 Tax=Splendidivirga corallicola TaxID=3051826 RepID=A0ABT8KVK5_9BACT|nr:phosphoenolpyruvate mutase [Fulvivirgaceae bacterium BMA10]